MSKELSYTNLEGHTIFTSQFLKNKGTCCKSACLHCPYGYTIKKLGFEFRSAKEEDYFLIEAILTEASQQLEWRAFLPDHLLMIELKGMLCGFLIKNHIIVKSLHLKPHFRDQGISKELIESYLFI